jgi:hypothetical protein
MILAACNFEKKSGILNNPIIPKKIIINPRIIKISAKKLTILGLSYYIKLKIY